MPSVLANPAAVQATLAYLICNVDGRDDPYVLLGTKQAGLGTGLINGPGGKCKVGETVEDGAKRELHEETGIRWVDIESSMLTKTAEFQHAATVQFRWPAKPDNDMDVQVFVGNFTVEMLRDRPHGQETPEFRPNWYPISGLPWSRMWRTDRLWLPQVLDGRSLEAYIEFEPEGVYPQLARIERT